MQKRRVSAWIQTITAVMTATGVVSSSSIIIINSNAGFRDSEAVYRIPESDDRKVYPPAATHLPESVCHPEALAQGQCWPRNLEDHRIIKHLGTTLFSPFTHEQWCHPYDRCCCAQSVPLAAHFRGLVVCA